MCVLYMHQEFVTKLIRILSISILWCFGVSKVPTNHTSFLGFESNWEDRWGQMTCFINSKGGLKNIVYPVCESHTEEKAPQCGGHPCLSFSRCPWGMSTEYRFPWEWPRWNDQGSLTLIILWAQFYFTGSGLLSLVWKTIFRLVFLDIPWELPFYENI